MTIATPVAPMRDQVLGAIKAWAPMLRNVVLSYDDEQALVNAIMAVVEPPTPPPPPPAAQHPAPPTHGRSPKEPKE